MFKGALLIYRFITRKIQMKPYRSRFLANNFIHNMGWRVNYKDTKIPLPRVPI